MYSIDVQPKFKKKVNKVKNKKERSNIWNKMQEVANTLEINPNHYKNLHKPLQEYKRVHVNGSYVILFIVDKTNRKVTFHNYAHHDNIY
jgi:YafQ family addiction module toxin component